MHGKKKSLSRRDLAENGLGSSPSLKRKYVFPTIFY
jgi:hypothetical protein